MVPPSYPCDQSFDFWKPAQDSSFDAIDHSELDERKEEVNEEVKRQRMSNRGSSHTEWYLVERFATVEVFRASEIYSQLKKFTLKNSWRSGQNKVESWVCKYSRKAQFKKCPRILKLEYLPSRMGVFIFDNDKHCDHESDHFNTRGTNKRYSWTKQHNQIFFPLMAAGSSAKVILRELWAHKLTDVFGNYPTLLQINTKKNYLFKREDIRKGRQKNAPSNSPYQVNIDQ